MMKMVSCAMPWNAFLEQHGLGFENGFLISSKDQHSDTLNLYEKVFLCLGMLADLPIGSNPPFK